MDRLFPVVSDLLSTRGLFYLVTIKENNPGITLFALNSLIQLKILKIPAPQDFYPCLKILLVNFL